MLLSTTVLINHRGVLSVHSLHYAASATTSFVTDIKSVYGATTIDAILWSILSFVVRTTTGRVRLLNNFCSKFPLLVSVTFSLPFLVWVTVFGSNVGSPCVSLAFDVPDLTSLIVKSFNEYTSLYDLSSFSLVNIAFAFSLCVMEVWLNVSLVTLLASDIYSSPTTLHIDSQIFSFNNSVLLW